MSTEPATASPYNFPGSDSATTTSEALDNPSNLNYFEPEREDEQASQDGQKPGIDPNREQSEGEEETQEDDDLEVTETEQETEEEEGQTETDQSLLPDTTLIMLGNEQIPLLELKNGYLREKDYRLKTADLGNSRRNLKALTDRVNGSIAAMSEFLANQVPPAPSPQTAVTDPGRYVREQALHDAAMAQLSELFSSVDDVKEVQKTMTEEEAREEIAREASLLSEAIPEVKANPKAFFDKAFATGKELGFTDAEMGNFRDHRYFKVMHYAMKGLAAEKALKKAKTKVQTVPPMAPTRRPQGQVANSAKVQKEAVRRLEKTGSIKDAMKIDFI